MAGDRANVAGSMSAKRGTPPAWTTAAAVAKNVLAGTITVRPSRPRPASGSASARRAISSAAVPLLTATAWADLVAGGERLFEPLGVGPEGQRPGGERLLDHLGDGGPVIGGKRRPGGRYEGLGRHGRTLPAASLSHSAIPTSRPAFVLRLSSGRTPLRFARRIPGRDATTGNRPAQVGSDARAPLRWAGMSGPVVKTTAGAVRGAARRGRGGVQGRAVRRADRRGAALPAAGAAGAVGRRARRHRGGERLPAAGLRRGRAGGRPAGRAVRRARRPVRRHPGRGLPDGQRVDAVVDGRRRPPGHGLVPRRRLDDGLGQLPALRRRAPSPAGATWSSSASTTGSGRSATCTSASSAARTCAASGIAGGARHGRRRWSGCGTTSPPSAATPATSRSSASRAAAPRSASCSATPAAAGLFHRAIIQSGPMLRGVGPEKARRHDPGRPRGPRRHHASTSCGPCPPTRW